MTTDKEEYQNFDDLELFLTQIEGSTVTFNPERSVQFRIIKPFDHSEKVLRWNRGTLIFRNVLFCDIRLLNEVYEYPEFHRSAILSDSKLLDDTITKLERIDKPIPEKLKHYYLSIDLGNEMTEIHMICEGHEFTLENSPKLLTEFKGLNND